MSPLSLDYHASRRRAEEHDWRPRNCVWELTLACPLRCRHCGSAAGHARPDELSLSACLDIVAQLHGLGCELITLSGGEPTLRDGWDLIARTIAARGIKVNLVTCGVYGTPDAAADIAARGAAAGLCNIGVSLDGTEATHEALRGRGTFAAVRASIAAFVRAGLEVTVLTTVSALNVDELPAIRQVAMDAGATAWRLQLAKPMGKLSEHRDWVIPPRRLLEVIPWLARVKQEGPISVGVGDSIGYYGAADEVLRGRGWRGRAERWQGCQAGMQAIGIEADGGVKGCLSLQPPTAGVDRFREASLRDASLEELWYRPGIFAFNRDFTAAQLRGACRSCAHAALCRGGARCVGVAVTGDVGEDPYCYHRLLTQPARDRGWRRQAAAAAAAVVLGLGGAGCGDRALLGAEPGVDAGPDAHVTLDARADGGGPDAISCEDICCLCEYGFGPPGPSDEWLRCCAVDYGVAPPPDGGAIGRDAAPPVTAADAGGSDAINCEGVCCGCDYGAEPPPGCCHG